MTLSIIIPYYNNNSWIARTLDSLMDQDLDPSDYEIIVVDDGSDEEPAVVKEYESRHAQISYHRRDHSGVAAARNYGLSLARGNWLHFCDGDDIIRPMVFGGLVSVAEEKGLEMVFTRRVWIKPSDPLPEPHRNFSSVSGIMTGMEYLGDASLPLSWGMGSYLLKRSVVEKHNLSFENIFYVEDRMFMIDLLQKTSRVAYVDVDLYCYIQHEVSILHSKRKQNGPDFIAAEFVFLDKLAAMKDTPDIPGRTLDNVKMLCANEAYNILINAFRYCPVEQTVDSISRLKEMGIYPIGKTDNRIVSRVRPLINCRHLWVFFCRCYHLLPQRLRFYS